MNEINNSPETLLSFAKSVAEERATSNSHIISFLEKEISVGGKPFSMGKQMTNLERQDWDLDDMSPDSVKTLHQASKVLRAIEPTWDVTKFMPDPRIAGALEALDSVEKKSEATQAMARRAVTNFVSVDKPGLTAGIQFKL